MVRCSEGHFYDPAKHTTCPWCAKPPDLGPAAAFPAILEPPEVITGVKLPPLAVPPTIAETPQTRPIAEVTAPQPLVPMAPLSSSAPTIAIPTPPPAPPTPPVLSMPSPTQTRRLGARDLAVDPVVGWLVCIEGGDRGRDWRLHAERNFIGRDPRMDVCIANDEGISRDRHAILTFDPRKQEFKLQPGESTGMVYLNGEALYVPQTLRNQDVIELGETKLMFISFAGATFQW